VPTLAFEPNAVPGFANRMVAPMVSAAAVHFEQTRRYFRNCTVTGVPVRQAFFDAAERKDHGAPTLLVFGGSQGAHAINQAMIDALPLLQQKVPELQIIHQTGERDYNDAEAAYRKTQLRAEVHRFIDDMPARFAQADLIVCRSGASTVAEIAAAGKPALFVPFPRAADDHQKVNAQALVNQNAAAMIEESQLTPARLAETVISLMGNRARLAAMGEAAKKLSHPNAAREIAAMVARLAGKQTAVAQ
jgi:UDP-N-acetylglucosamine--N-acetylmuramyl-(pentapeptide) pyrophosphoryl-undecaprenol N-acetylglucosamine transferase